MGTIRGNGKGSSSPPGSQIVPTVRGHIYARVPGELVGPDRQWHRRIQGTSMLMMVPMLELTEPR